MASGAVCKVQIRISDLCCGCSHTDSAVVTLRRLLVVDEKDTALSEALGCYCFAATRGRRS